MRPPQPASDVTQPIRRSALAAFDRWGMVPAGIIVLALGRFFWNRGSGSELDAGLLYALGAFLVGRGVYLAADAIRARIRPAPADPLAPFEHDHPWPDRGETRRPTSSEPGRLTRTLIWYFGFAALAAWIAFFICVALMVVPADSLSDGSAQLIGQLVISAIVSAFAYWLLRAATAPQVRVTYTQRPYRLGAPVTVRIGLSREGSAVGRLTATLRCIRERGTARGGKRGTVDTSVAATELWSDTVTIEDRDAIPTPSADVDVTFVPPTGLPGTELAAPLATYWELVVQLGSGGEHAASLGYTFLLPVYEANAIDSAPSKLPSAQQRAR